MDLHHKKSDYANIPVAVSLLHIKEYTNILKRNNKSSRRTSSETNTKSTQPFIIVANPLSASIHKFHSEVDV